uniref:Uncharacterized protein n=1 Tax=Musca domestica TaxID=7370 RepID=A0A1I8NL01_MUSDO
MSPNNSVQDSSFRELNVERINKFSLVAFHNNELHIVDSKRIKQREGDNCTVNFKGCFYAARLILSSASPFGKTRRVRWTREEREAIESIFGVPTTLEKLQYFKQCANAVKHKCLNLRTTTQVKTWINNQQKKWQDSSLFIYYIFVPHSSDEQFQRSNSSYLYLNIMYNYLSKKKRK